MYIICIYIHIYIGLTQRSHPEVSDAGNSAQYMYIYTYIYIYTSISISIPYIYAYI